MKNDKYNFTPADFEIRRREPAPFSLFILQPYKSPVTFFMTIIATPHYAPFSPGDPITSNVNPDNTQQGIKPAPDSTGDVAAEEIKARGDELSFVARTVGDDYCMGVTLGPEGGGSFFDLAESRIVIDRLVAFGSRTKAIYTAGHEGAHRLLTPRLHELPFPKKELEMMFEQTGFQSTFNVVEDPAVNDGMVRKFPGIEPAALKTIEGQALETEGLFSTTEILAWVQRNGRVPRFAKALGELFRHWARARLEHGFESAFRDLDSRLESSDQDVAFVLKLLRKIFAETISLTLESGHESKEDLRRLGIRRFRHVKEAIFPEISRLLERDRLDEELRDAASSGMSSEGSDLSEETRKELEEAAKNGRKQGAKAAADAFEDALGKHAEANAQGDESEAGKAGRALSKKDLEEMADAIAGSDSSLRERLQEKIEAAGSGAGQEPGTASHEEPSAEEEAVEKNTGETESPREKTSSEALADEIEASWKEQEESEGRPAPIDPRKLSDDARKELEEALARMSEEEKAELKERAEARLRDLDKAMAESTHPMAEDQRAPSRSGAMKRGEREEQNRRWQERSNALSRYFSRALEASLSPYELLFRAVAQKVDDAFSRLRPLFRPENDFTWNEGHPDGQRLNEKGAMQFEANPLHYAHLFDKRLTPQKVNYAISLLVDCSGSMEGQKMEQSRRGIVFLTELFTRLNITHCISAFNEGVSIVKDWGESISDSSIRKRIGEELQASGTTYDAHAVDAQYEKLKECRELHKFIFVISDSESMQAQDLIDSLGKIKAAGDVTVIHFGLGAGTTDTMGLYDHSFGDLSITDTSDEKRDFLAVYCGVIEDVICHPEKYARSKEERQ